ncbi:coiled-coil domain-containing protein [Parvibacter caecicola]|uniref:coiled-coil domain-containing protein n=1 Tax=Parvibacter caecicola TaxID=747645 RepID=UPI00249A97FD|nr:C40 family peptidase [Parvibacter caecicola]
MREQQTQLSRRAFIGGTAAIFGTAILFSPTAAFGEPTSADKKKEAEEAAAAAASKQAEANEAMVQLTALAQEADKASADYFTALDEQQAAQDRMDACQARIEEISGELAALQERLGDRARSMYRSGSLTFLDLLLGATSFSAFTQNWDLLNKMNQQDADTVQQTKDLKAEAEAQHEEFTKQEQIAEEKAEECERIAQQAQAAQDAQEAIYNSLSAEVSQLLAQQQAAQEEAERLAAKEELERQRREAEEERRRQQEAERAAQAAEEAKKTYGGDDLPAASNGVVARAYAEMGKPYVWGATGPNSYDCSGLVGYALTGHHSRIGTTYTFMGWPRVSNPQPGDVVTNSYHCGIYIGGGQMVHAPQRGDVVKVGSVFRDMIYVRYRG